jgi:hypothetical protein
MGLYRTALRLATIEALRPAAMLQQAAPCWPTLAQGRVFNSRIDPIEDLTVDHHKAVVVVYTDEDQGYGSQTRGGPPFRRVVDLCFHISQIACVAAEGGGDQYQSGVPETDDELEFELDLIEFQIGQALLFSPAGRIWRRLCGSMVADPRSVPKRDSEEGARLAMRELIWKVQVPDDLPDALPIEDKTGVARLPRPLRDVVCELPPGRLQTIAAALGNATPALPKARPLRLVMIGGELVRPGGQRTGVANVSAQIPLSGYPAAVVADAGGNVESV